MEETAVEANKYAKCIQVIVRSLVSASVMDEAE